MAEASKVLRVGTLTPISTLDPRQASDLVAQLVIHQVFDTPLKISGVGEEERVVPGLLASWEKSGERRYQGEVRDGARFSDGTPVTAQDIARAVVAGVGERFKVRTSVMGTRLTFELEAAEAGFERLLTARQCHVVREVDGKLLGSGAFQVAETTDDGVKLEINPHSESRPTIEGVEIRRFEVGADGTARTLAQALDDGEVDFTLALSRDDASVVKTARKLFRPGWSTSALFFNLERPHFADPDVRRRLAATVDRYRLAQICFENPAGFVARGLLPPRMGGVPDGLRPNPEMAKELVGTLPKKLRLITVWGPRPYLPRPGQVGAAIAEVWASLGTTVEVEVTRDAAHYFEVLRGGDYDLVLGGWVADTPDPVDFAGSLLESSAIPIEGRPTALTCNLARFHDEAVDRELARARQHLDQDALRRALERVAQQVPLVPLMYGPTVIAHGWNVKGFDPDASLIPDFAQIELDD